MNILSTESPQVSTPKNAAAPLHHFTLSDRCDRCGAQAWVYAEKNGSSLMFCGHHGKKSLAGLETMGFAVNSQIHNIPNGQFTMSNGSTVKNR